ncbi:MAG TPA: serine/threonine-protein kinase [Myxococcales bacterium]|nr:serine/threonine-protein kinase [Myxococcales bacterium]
MGEAVATLKEGQILGKDFRIVRPLAAGGMGAVYLVEQLSTGRERALKIMHPQFVQSADSRARFTQEAKVGARIRSDHVVEVVSAGVDDDTGIPWLAMELLDGEELAKRISRKRFLSSQETLEIFRQLCHALGEAHRSGLVHRDLKPANIFMARSRRQGEAFTVKILDFGVAKLVQEQAGEGDHTKPVGTPRWMAPEQSESGAPIRPATDVWALGLIAFNCLTGKHYWKAANQSQANVTALLRELVVEPMPPASVRAAELGATSALPRGFDEWFARCVARDAARRFQDANAALDALAPVLEKAPAWKPAGAGAASADDEMTTPQPAGAATPAPVDADVATAKWGEPTQKAGAPVASHQGSTKPSAQPATAPTQPMPQPSRAPLFAGIFVGVAALAVAALALMRSSPRQAPLPVPNPVPAPVPAAPMPEAFTVVFDSFPSGAALYEGEQKLGETPMQLSLRNAGLDAQPRKFRIVREGFLPYEVVQGPSREPVKVLATLAPDPEAQKKQAEEQPKEKPKKREPQDAPDLRIQR